MVYRTQILPFVFCWYETRSVTLKEEIIDGFWEQGAVKNIWPKREGIMGNLKKK
jgi:hypothetical protein